MRSNLSVGLSQIHIKLPTLTMLQDPAEFGKIGKYYAVESMLVRASEAAAVCSCCLRC